MPIGGAGSGGDSGAGGGPAAGPFEGEGDPWIEPAPRATCGSGDMPETGLQGDNGDIRCNLVVHGQVAAPHFLSHAWYEHCAYVNGTDGTTVIDVSDSANPSGHATLTTTGMQSNWETMKVNEDSGLLAGYQSNGPVLDIYDVAEDCTHPVLAERSFDLGGSGHAGSSRRTARSTTRRRCTRAGVRGRPRRSEGSEGDHHRLRQRSGARSVHRQGRRPRLLRLFGADRRLGIGHRSRSWTRRRCRRARPARRAALINEWPWPDGNVSQYPIADHLSRQGLPADHGRARLGQRATIPRSRRTATRASSTSATRRTRSWSRRSRPKRRIRPTARGDAGRRRVLRRRHALLQRRPARRPAAARLRVLGGRRARLRHPQSVAPEGAGVLRHARGERAGARAHPASRSASSGSPRLPGTFYVLKFAGRRARSRSCKTERAG